VLLFSQETYPVLPQAQESQLRIFNGMPCTYNFETDIPDHQKFTIKPLELFEEHHVPVVSNQSFTYKMSATPTGPGKRVEKSIEPQLYLILNIFFPTECPELRGTFLLAEQKSISYFVRQVLVPIKKVELMEYEDDPNKTKDGSVILR
jgi:solute carrier family 15 (oligopeptide transporter), member 1